jgi:hypothetical protein
MIMVVALSFLIFYPAGWTAPQVADILTVHTANRWPWRFLLIQYTVNFLLILMLAKLFQRFEVSRDTNRSMSTKPSLLRLRLRVPLLRGKLLNIRQPWRSVRRSHRCAAALATGACRRCYFVGWNYFTSGWQREHTVSAIRPGEVRRPKRRRRC